jgi:hypothetical protein
MRTNFPCHVRFSVLIILLISVVVPVLLPAGPQQQVSASSDGPLSIPGSEVIIRAIPNTGEGFFVPPPPPEMRLSPNAPEAATINVTYINFPSGAQTAFQYAVNICGCRLARNDQHHGDDSLGRRAGVGGYDEPDRDFPVRRRLIPGSPTRLPTNGRAAVMAACPMILWLTSTAMSPPGILE